MGSKKSCDSVGDAFSAFIRWVDAVRSALIMGSLVLSVQNMSDGVFFLLL